MGPVKTRPCILHNSYTASYCKLKEIWTLFGLDFVFFCDLILVFTRVHYYRQISFSSGTKSQNFYDYPLALSNPLKPGIKSKMKVQSKRRRQALLQIHMSDQQVTKVRLISEVWR